MSVGFVNVNPLPESQGMGAYEMVQMPERILEGNKIPYGPMLAQRIYPFMGFKQTAWNSNQANPMTKLTPSPIDPVLQNMGPIIAAPVTAPEGAYAQEQPALGDVSGTVKWAVIGGIVLVGFIYLMKGKKK